MKTTMILLTKTNVIIKQKLMILLTKTNDIIKQKLMILTKISMKTLPSIPLFIIIIITWSSLLPQLDLFDRVKDSHNKARIIYIDCSYLVMILLYSIAPIVLSTFYFSSHWIMIRLQISMWIYRIILGFLHL